MNTNALTPHEKSVLLAKLCGWYIHEDGMIDGAGCVDQRLYIDNLYDPIAMALAWRLLVEMYITLPTEQLQKLNLFWMGQDDYPYKDFLWTRLEAQAAWLDKILELAIEAGMVELDVETCG